MESFGTSARAGRQASAQDLWGALLARAVARAELDAKEAAELRAWVGVKEAIATLSKAVGDRAEA